MTNRPIGTDSQWDDSSHQRRRIHKSSHRKRCGPHSCHYRWPGWIERCKRYGITHSMSKKGCSPDNSAMEGFFGRLKVEFFCGRDWSGWSIHGFMDALDEYLHRYNEERIELSQLAGLPLTALPSRVISISHCPPTRDARLTGQDFFASVTVFVCFLQRHGTGPYH